MQSQQDKSAQESSVSAVVDSWGIAKFQDEDGEVRLIRFNSGFIPWRGKPQFPVRMGIAIPSSAEDFGDDWDAQLEQVEEKLFELCKQSGKAVVTLFITEPHYKETLLYLASVEDGEALMDGLDSLGLKLVFEYYFEVDADWQVYWSVADDLDLLPKFDGEEQQADQAEKSRTH